MATSKSTWAERTVQQIRDVLQREKVEYELGHSGQAIYLDARNGSFWCINVEGSGAPPKDSYRHWRGIRDHVVFRKSWQSHPGRGRTRLLYKFDAPKLEAKVLEFINSFRAEVQARKDREAVEDAEQQRIVAQRIIAANALQSLTEDPWEWAGGGFQLVHSKYATVNRNPDATWTVKLCSLTDNQLADILKILK